MSALAPAVDTAWDNPSLSPSSSSSTTPSLSSSSSPSSHLPSDTFHSPASFIQQRVTYLINGPPHTPSSPPPPPPSQVTSTQVLQQLLAGGIAGSVARTVVAPLDRVKMLMQTQYLLHNPFSSPPPPPPASLPSPPLRTLGLSFPLSLPPSLPTEKYHNLLQSLRTICSEEGVRQLWKGNLLNVTRVFPYSAIQFSSYDAFKSLLKRPGERLSPQERLTAGALAGMAATSFTHPMDVIRLRLSIHPELTGIRDSFHHVVTEGGVRALFKGFIPTMLSVSPFIAINFATFDLLKQHVALPPSTLSVLLMGGVSGMLAQSVCYPLDTIRRRQQMKGRHYSGMIDAFVQICRQEGVRGLYRGMGVNALKVVPNNAIRFLVFEQVKKQMGIEGGASGGC